MSTDRVVVVVGSGTVRPDGVVTTATGTGGEVVSTGGVIATVDRARGRVVSEYGAGKWVSINRGAKSIVCRTLANGGGCWANRVEVVIITGEGGNYFITRDWVVTNVSRGA